MSSIAEVSITSMFYRAYVPLEVIWIRDRTNVIVRVKSVCIQWCAGYRHSGEQTYGTEIYLDTFNKDPAKYKAS